MINYVFCAMLTHFPSPFILVALLALHRYISGSHFAFERRNVESIVV